MLGEKFVEHQRLKDVSSGVLEAVLGITHPTVGALKERGAIVSLPGPRGHWDLQDCVQNYISYIKEQRSGRTSREQKTAQETRKLMLVNDTAEGKLVPVVDASRIFAEYSASVRAGITSLPGRLASQLAGKSKPAEIRALIHAEVSELLDAAEAIFGQLQAQPEATTDRGSGTSDPKATAKQNNGRVGRRKPDTSKGKRRTRKVA